MSRSLDLPVLDATSLRGVFAAPEEMLLFVLAEVEAKSDLGEALRLIEGASRPARRVRIVACGSAEALKTLPATVDRVGPATEPLLPVFLRVVDGIVAFGEASKKRVAAIHSPGNSSPFLLTTMEEVRHHFGTTVENTRRTHRLVLQNDWGIGDELLLSAVARELVRGVPGTEVWIRSRFGFQFPSYVEGSTPPSDAKVIETIYQNATLYGPGAHSPFPGHLVQQMLDKVALDTGLRVRAKDLRPELRLQAVPKTIRPTVVVHSQPNPRLPSKDWSIERWTALVGLLQSAGIAVRQVGHAQEPLLPGAEDHRGLPVSKLPELFSESWAIVCVVGFLMHLAEATSTPAVVIYGGREHPAIDGYPNQVHLSSGPFECRGRWGCHLGPEVACPHGMRCMEDITPKRVAREVMAVLKGAVS